MLKSLIVGGMAIAAIAAAGSAQAGPCLTAPASVYTTTGFSCTIGTFKFSSFAISPSTTGTGVVGPITVIPVANGLSLSFSAAASAPPASTADITWLYKVSSAVPIVDASLLVTGSGLSHGIVVLDETLSNGATLHASRPGSAIDTVTFAPVSSLTASKDLANIALVSGALALSSIVQNTFSTIPEPASIALLGAGLVGLGLSRRSRRSK